MAALGVLVGAAELASRYRDHPAALWRVPGAWVYAALNAAAALGSLALVRSFGWDFGTTDASAATTMQVLVAGFGSVALFRSSLFTLRVQDQDVPVGPSLLLATLLSVADESVNRARARERASRVERVMTDTSFEKARLALPALTFALLQHVPKETQSEVATAVNGLAKSRMSDVQKARNLGLLLMNVAGPDVVASAVQTLGAEIRRSG